MSEVERNSDRQRLVIARFSGNHTLLTLVVVKTGSRHSDRLTHLPINWLDQSHSHLSRLNRGIEVSPGGEAGDAVHAELAVFASDHLVPKGGQLFPIVIPIEGEGEFILIRVRGCACPKLASVEQEVTGIEGHVLLISEDDISSLNDNGVQLGRTRIHKQSHARWDIH